jgi:hypothetical protein
MFLAWAALWLKLKAKYKTSEFVLSPVLAQKLHSLIRNLFNNDSTGVFDGKDCRRRHEDGERKRSQVC